MRNSASRLNVEIIDDFSRFTGLFCHQLVAKQICCIGFNIVTIESNLDSALHHFSTSFWVVKNSFSTTSGVYLALNSNNFARQIIVSSERLFYTRTMNSGNYWKPSISEQALSLIFVYVHSNSTCESVDLKPVFEYLPACPSYPNALSCEESLEVRVFNRR